MSVAQAAFLPGPCSPQPEDPSGDLGTRGARDLLGQCRPKLGLGPPKPRIETALDIFPRQRWWAGYPSPGLTSGQAFQAFPSTGDGGGAGGVQVHFG